MVGWLCVIAPVGRAAPTHVAVDLSGIGSPFELEIQLYSLSAPYGNSWARIDNLVAGSEAVDFEDGSLGGFDDSWNPGRIVTVAGTITGAGTHVLEIREDPAYLSTITYRSFTDPSALVLSFDLRAVLYGRDELVLRLLDPDTGAPMLEGLHDFGDILRLTAAGIQASEEVTLSIIVPVPGALGLVLLGLVGLSCGRRGHR